MWKPAFLAGHSGKGGRLETLSVRHSQGGGALLVQLPGRKAPHSLPVP